MKVAIIPAKGTSRRIPHKNARLFFGQPILAYSIETALRSALFDAIYVSTENSAIAQIAWGHGADVIDRPAELAEIGASDCGTQEVTRHAIETLHHCAVPVQLVCCIYPTAPLLHPAELVRGLAALQDHPNCPFAYAVGPDGRDAGQFYWGSAASFLGRVPLSPFTAWKVYLAADCIDINTEADWVLAEALYRLEHPELEEGVEIP